jgi:hypothetical protein
LQSRIDLSQFLHGGGKNVLTNIRVLPLMGRIGLASRCLLPFVALDLIDSCLKRLSFKL